MLDEVAGANCPSRSTGAARPRGVAPQGAIGPLPPQPATIASPSSMCCDVRGRRKRKSQSKARHEPNSPGHLDHGPMGCGTSPSRMVTCCIRKTSTTIENCVFEGEGVHVIRNNQKDVIQVIGWRITYTCRTPSQSKNVADTLISTSYV